jgi:hypothetical protein
MKQQLIDIQADLWKKEYRFGSSLNKLNHCANTYITIKRNLNIKVSCYFRNYASYYVEFKIQVAKLDSPAYNKEKLKWDLVQNKVPMFKLLQLATNNTKDIDIKTMAEYLLKKGDK